MGEVLYTLIIVVLCFSLGKCEVQRDVFKDCTTKGEAVLEKNVQIRCQVIREDGK